MKNKVLIIYPYINQEQMVYHMVINLRENGINVDAINSTYFRFAAKPLIKASFRLKIISFFHSLPVPKIKGLLSRVLNLKEDILKIAENYDLIDFHVFYEPYDDIIIKLIGNKKVKITIWGSDFYRRGTERREQQRVIFKQCNCIQVSTPTMRTDFIQYFQSFDDKIRVANFGIFLFDIISEMQKISYVPKFKLKKYNNRLVLSCGYNGSEAQQHSIIINSLNGLDKSIKDTVFLVFPMTYGSTKVYTKKIESELINLGIPFLVLKSNLSTEEMAKLRIETDLVINIQKTDAFSGSLQEHLFAGNLLLVGDWLPYDILDENKVFYKKCNIDDLSTEISDCIVNYDKYKKQTYGNKGKMHEISSWSVAGKKMSTIYKNLLQ